jgi:hypothetical protein
VTEKTGIKELDDIKVVGTKTTEEKEKAIAETRKAI